MKTTHERLPDGRLVVQTGGMETAVQLGAFSPANDVTLAAIAEVIGLMHEHAIRQREVIDKLPLCNRKVTAIVAGGREVARLICDVPVVPGARYWITAAEAEANSCHAAPTEVDAYRVGGEDAEMSFTDDIETFVYVAYSDLFDSREAAEFAQQKGEK